MRVNKLLEQQIKDNYGSIEAIPEAFKGLFVEISKSYDNFEQNHQSLEKSIDNCAGKLKTNDEKIGAQAELQRVNKELQEFVYIASHDLKEPLRSIKSFAQILNMKLAKTLEADHLEFFQFITDGVKRMETLLDDLLEFAKIGENDQQLEYVNLNNALETVRKNLRVRIEENEATIISDSLPTIKAAPTRMQQLLQNLITNAIKFRGEAAPKIEITCSQTNQFHTISIKDNGIGIDEAYKQKVFKVFQRLNSRNAYDGSGIGLSICEKIVNHLNGEIWFESEVGQGTTFHFTLPVLVEEMAT